MALVKGDKGQAVKELQTALNRAGCNLEVDGKFGQATYTAVISFQGLYDLTVDGKAGPQTMAKLEEVRCTKLGEAITKCVAKLEDLPEFKRVMELM